MFQGHKGKKSSEEGGVMGEREEVREGVWGQGKKTLCLSHPA